MTRVIVNGAPHDFEQGTRLRQAVIASGADARTRGLAVALDGEVVPRRRWDAIELEEGQRVEVVQAVQGG